MAAKPQDSLTTGFMQRVLFVILAIALSFLAFKLMNLWLLIFGAIIFAVILRGLAEPLLRYTPLSPPFAVLIVVVAVLSVFALTFYLFGRVLADQAQTLQQQIPVAWAALQEKLQGTAIGRTIQNHIATLGQQAGGMVSSLPVIAGNVLTGVADTLVALIGGIILAMHPVKYRDGVVRLFPTDHHDWIRDAMNAAGQALRLWFIGQFISMVIVGTLVSIGLSIEGLPSALALGLLAGLAQFIPLVGATVSACLGLLLAGLGGWQPFLWTLLIYTAVSQSEANFITPMVQRRITEVPMVLTLFAVLGFAGLIGPMGVLYAVPMTVILYTLTRRYLDRRDAEMEKENSAPSA
jgi:predicted PurR-regulated permease PerM